MATSTSFACCFPGLSRNASTRMKPSIFSFLFFLSVCLGISPSPSRVSAMKRLSYRVVPCLHGTAFFSLVAYAWVATCGHTLMFTARNPHAEDVLNLRAIGPFFHSSLFLTAEVFFLSTVSDRVSVVAPFLSLCLALCLCLCLSRRRGV